MSTISELEALIKSAERSIARGDFDAAEAGIDYANSVIRKAKQAASDDEADDDYDDPSNPSADAADDDDGDDDGADDEDDDDDDSEVSKAYHEHSNAGSPHRMRGQHVRVQKPETYRLSATPPPEGPGKRHRFISRAEHIRRRDGVSRTESLVRARQEFPETFTDYQDHLSRRSTRRQHMVRGWENIGKSDTFQDHVAAELRKSAGSLTHEMAAQRVAQAHGFRAFDNQMFKGESVVARFESKVNSLIRKGYDGTTACQLVREAEPVLFKAMQLLT
jgi:hypothetical protein